MSLDLDRAVASNDRKGQVGWALGIDAGRQTVKLEAELSPARRRGFCWLWDGQSPLRGRAFNKQFDGFSCRRAKVDGYRWFCSAACSRCGEAQLCGRNMLRHVRFGRRQCRIVLAVAGHKR